MMKRRHQLRDRRDERKCVWESIGRNIIDCVGPDSYRPFSQCNVSSHFEWHSDALIKALEGELKLPVLLWRNKTPPPSEVNTKAEFSGKTIKTEPPPVPPHGTITNLINRGKANVLNIDVLLNRSSSVIIEGPSLQLQQCNRVSLMSFSFKKIVDVCFFWGGGGYTLQNVQFLRY